MTTLRTEMTAAIKEFIEAEGEEALYIPLSGSSLPCKVWLDYEVQADASPRSFMPQSFEGATVLEAVLENIGQTPVHGGAFVIDGETYDVLEVFHNDGITAKMTVTKQ